ncbi:hypothetical protein K443DRAFT_646228 [Laccaria amethystina LaAM-08-1]|uniref:Uncharacterized protein n=1 Tax=Laccaria amethystina LaAM-08-1 TaxID=1095629 RepID=A0A0C9XAP1_9AGAR|nr:hypothetical protein K443DRAFT_646228 [Laccaria amethystina LaAM-08-1]
MPTKMPLLLSARIYLLRFVVPLCIASLLLLFSGPLFWEYMVLLNQWQHWFALGMFSFILVHHLLLTFNLDPFYGLVDLPLLLLELAGIGYYIQFFTKSVPQDLLSFKNCLVVYCALATFLFLEALLRMGSLILYLSQHHVLLHHQTLIAEDSLKPYQIMFGRSTSIRFLNGTTVQNMSTQYYVSSSQMKFVVSGRRILLQLVLLSSFPCMGLLPSVWQSLAIRDFFWFSMLVFIILHHLVSCFNLEFEYGSADLPALFFEITNIAPHMTELGSTDSWASTSLITYKILAWVIFISLVLEVLIWVGCVALYITQHVWSSTTSNFSGQKVSKPHKVLFGHAAWRRHFSGETNIIRLSRGLFATILILTLLSSLVINAFLGPIQETGITPTKDLRSLEPPWILISETITLNVILACNFSCPYDPQATYLSPHIVTFAAGQFQVNKFNCDFYLFMYTLKPDYKPELLITLNFTGMGLQVSTMGDLSTDSVQIIIGLTNDTRTVFERTVGTTIIPGVNLFGVMTWDFRQLLKRPHLSAFGSLFDSYETIAVSRMLSVYPDPLASESPLIQQGRDVSSFRVKIQSDLSESKVLQEYRSRSVLQGFSQVGGLWTFLTGVFAAIFGTFPDSSPFFPLFSETLFRNKTNFISRISSLYAAEENREGLPRGISEN